MLNPILYSLTIIIAVIAGACIYRAGSLNQPVFMLPNLNKPKDTETTTNTNEGWDKTA